MSRRGIVLAVAVALASQTPCAAQVFEYYHLDALGSARVVTDAAGSVLERHDYLPFGEECATGPCASNPGVGAGQPRKFTGKERDLETALDYFGARYYRSSAGRLTTADPIGMSGRSLMNPQRWNRYAYAGNNPLARIDPDGRDWFEVHGEWSWSPASGGRTHIVFFDKTGSNSEGAATGTVTLYEQDEVLASSSGFSGGHGYGEIPEGTFTIRLDIRGTAHDQSALTPDRNALKPFYGMQRIAPEIVDESGTPIGNARVEWGSIRAALNEREGERRPAYLGNYLHGKERPGDFTHGCICERSESVLGRLESLDHKKVRSVPVSVRDLR